MATAVTRFAARDGMEFRKEAEAKEHDGFLLLRDTLGMCSAHKYSNDYDGPMPVSEIGLETLWRHRARVIHLLTDDNELAEMARLREENQNLEYKAKRHERQSRDAEFQNKMLWWTAKLLMISWLGFAAFKLIT